MKMTEFGKEDFADVVKHRTSRSCWILRVGPVSDAKSPSKRHTEERREEAHMETGQSLA